MTFSLKYWSEVVVLEEWTKQTYKEREESAGAKTAGDAGVT